MYEWVKIARQPIKAGCDPSLAWASWRILVYLPIMVLLIAYIPVFPALEFIGALQFNSFPVAPLHMRDSS
ncbi:MAG: hypothetical protein ACI9Y1_000785 [Lentisphaeria bacterium]|jgi:hypothetical protein